MPVYDYDCAACGRRFEVIHGVHADPPTTCPLCGSGPVRKAFAAPAIHFKGSGWAKKERHAAAKAKSSPGGSKDGGDGSASSGDAETPAKDAPADDARAKDAPPSSPSSTTTSSSTSGSTASGD